MSSSAVRVYQAVGSMRLNKIRNAIAVTHRSVKQWDIAAASFEIA
ncbi:MAG: hypothetical protein QNJ46_14195 [Leptolyngbyaceae cyanobacterium MO_188.B28]|nr:hypothetical protein [Leptolyngbyaceae cyanobacterium MO_188.B28]